MSSKKRTDASRNNGARGGPKSPKGKVLASENSIKHNIYDRLCPALSTEDGRLFIELRARFFRDYDPQGTVECETVEQLALYAWRVRRYSVCQGWFIEMELANQADHIAKTQGPDCDLAVRTSFAVKGCLEKSSGFKDLARFEARLARTYERLVRLIQDLQKDRLRPSAPAAKPEPQTTQKEENEPTSPLDTTPPPAPSPEIALENWTTRPWQPVLQPEMPEMPRLKANRTEAPPPGLAFTA